MAVQSKTLINDVGSAAVAELASQLNRAASHSSMIATEATATADEPGTASQFLALFTEDVFVEQVTIVFCCGTGPGDGLDQATDAVTLRTGVAADFGGGTTIFSATNYSGGGNAGHDVFHTPLTLADLGATVVVGSTGPWPIAAGDSLVLDVHTAVNSGLLDGIIRAFITYRPMKDVLTLKPTFTQAMRNFSSRAR